MAYSWDRGSSRAPIRLASAARSCRRPPTTPMPGASPRHRAGSARRCVAWSLVACRARHCWPAEEADVMAATSLRIGVLALQGGVAEHQAMLRRLGADLVAVRLPEHLEGLDGIVLPGGESTAIGKLMVEYGLLEPLRQRLQGGLPAYGTCAGMILLARDLGDSRQPA